jgi:hypothetical protein
VTDILIALACIGVWPFVIGWLWDCGARSRVDGQIEALKASYARDGKQLPPWWTYE